MEVNADGSEQLLDAAEPERGVGDSAIVDALLGLAHVRGEGKSFCPSEVARTLADDWRPLMPAVRRVGGDLVGQGRLICTQRGVPVDPTNARGPIRLAIASSNDSTSTDEASGQ